MSGIFSLCQEKPEATRRWLGMSEGQPYYQSLKVWRNELESKLESLTDTAEIYRTQGALKVVKRLLGLREELDEHEVGTAVSIRR